MREKAEDSYRLNASELFGARKARCRCGDREDLCGEDDEAHDLFGEAGECAGDAHVDNLQSTAGSLIRRKCACIYLNLNLKF